MVPYLVQHMLHQIKASQFYTDLGLQKAAFKCLQMVKFKDFSRPLSVFQGRFYFQRLFKTVLYIRVLFKPMRTLATNHSAGDNIHISIYNSAVFHVFFFLLSADFKINFSKKILQEHYQSLVSKSERHFVCTDLGPNCLQRISADSNSLLARKEASATFTQLMHTKGYDSIKIISNKMLYE